MYLYMHTIEMHEMYHRSVSAVFLRVFENGGLASKNCAAGIQGLAGGGE